MHARTGWFLAGLCLAGLVGISQIAGAAQAAHRSAPAASAGDASWAVGQCKAHELYAAYHAAGASAAPSPRRNATGRR